MVIESYKTYKTQIKIKMPRIIPNNALNETEGVNNSCMYQTIIKHIKY